MSQAYRYPGAQPFTANDRRIFYGRDRDTRRLAERIRLEQMMVLYGKSGLGKSSLLNAAVLPKLEEPKDRELKVFLPVTMRFGAYSLEHGSVRPIQRVLDRLQEFGTGGWPERFGETAPLWQALKSVQIANGDKQLFLVLDQFEELFTYPKSHQRRFALQMAQSLYEKVPQACRKMLEDGQVELTDKEREELFKPLNLKVLFAIRSDRMSYLDSLKNELPDILYKTYELLPLNRTQAEDAILNPAYLKDEDFAVPPFDYTDEALQKILDFLSPQKDVNIETTQLQIICQHAEHLVVEEKIAQKTSLGIPQVRPEDLGDLRKIYRTYYSAMLEEIEDPDERLKVRRLIEEDLIFEPDKRRISLYEGIIQSKGISPEILALLVNKHHILRTEPNMSGGYTYELSHDTLVEPILEAKNIRVAEERKAELEAQRKQAEADRIRAEQRAAEAERKAAEEAGLREEAEKGRKRARQRSVFAGIVSVIAVIAGLWAWKANQDAKDNLYSANRNLSDAYRKQIQQDSLKVDRYRRDSVSFDLSGDQDLARMAGEQIKELRESIALYDSLYHDLLDEL